MSDHLVLDQSIRELHHLIVSKQVKVSELAEAAITRALAWNNSLHDFVTIRTAEETITQAKLLDDRVKADVSPLFGLPFSMKDAYCTSDLRTTAGSNVLGNFQPTYDATVYRKLKQTGAVLIGKNNQDAWGHGGSTENTDFTPAKNPWDQAHIPGGSSGGSAISIANRTVSFAVGEDTGGSIRNPANMCGISGLKVTYGRVSRFGAIAYASSLDTVGPMAKSVEDLAYVLSAIAGHDVLDATSAQQPVDKYESLLSGDIRGKVIGLPKEFYGEGLDPEVRALVETAAHKLEENGAILQEVSIPIMAHGVAIYYLLALSETSSNLARYDGIRYGADRSNFSPETMRRIMVGSFALSAGYADELYNRAQQARTMLIKEYMAALAKCDVLLAPVTPSSAPKIGELINDPVKNMLEDLYTVTINVVGVPSLAIPAGFTKSSIPVGMQLIGKKFAEASLLQLGHSYQQITNWHLQAPPTTKGTL